MRAQAFERMNKLLVKELEGILQDEENSNCDVEFSCRMLTRLDRIENLVVKSKILSNRDDDRSASVIKELINGDTPTS